jgi:hypothetical protein
MARFWSGSKRPTGVLDWEEKILWTKPPTREIALKSELEALESELEALKSELEALESELEALKLEHEAYGCAN